MKIYFDGIIYSWQIGGGVHRYFEEIIGRCGKNKDIETFLLAHLPTHNILPKEGVTIKNIIYLKSVPNFSFKLLRKILSPVNKILLENYFKNISIGIFHSTYYTTYKNLKIPQVLTVHDMTHEKFPLFFSSRGAKRFIANKRRCIMSANLIICVSESTKKALLDIYKIDDKKISVVYHGISEIFMSEAGHMENGMLKEQYFLFVGNRGLYKNFIFFIKAFSEWSKNKDYNILLIGGGKLSKKEFSIIMELGLDTQIEHIGFIEEKDLKCVYQNSKAFVFPSLDEGFGLPILEAIISETQVIASNIEVFKEIGEDMLIYFDPRKVESLIDALDRSISKELSKEEIRRRVKYVTNKFNWDKCFNKTVEIYHETINEKEN